MFTKSWRKDPLNLSNDSHNHSVNWDMAKQRALKDQKRGHPEAAQGKPADSAGQGP